MPTIDPDLHPDLEPWDGLEVSEGSLTRSFLRLDLPKSIVVAGFAAVGYLAHSEAPWFAYLSLLGLSLVALLAARVPNKEGGHDAKTGIRSNKNSTESRGDPRGP